MSTPEYDLVVFGATSFVGQILCRYLLDLNSSGESFKWAIAGRSDPKLRGVLRQLGQGADGLDVLVVNATDEAALMDMCQRTRVVISTVGPYALYGEPLIKSCAETGTDYCDLTGEVQWIREMAAKYQDQAFEAGARIVHCCGFDSIPSDMGVYFLQQQAMERLGQYCDEVKLLVKAANGGISGGTFASMMHLMEEAENNPELQAMMLDPYLICPDNHPKSKRQHSVESAEYDDDYNCWIAPFMMAVINERVVHRSNGLAGMIYGDNFTYHEAMMTTSGLKGKTLAKVVSGFMAFTTWAMTKQAMRAVFAALGPSPGDGPSEKAQLKGFFDIRLIGRTADGQSIQAMVTGDRDPGYGSTAKMLGQAGLSLAQDVTKAEKAGGIWTTATVFDQRFIDRLCAKSGMSFEIL